MSFDATQQPHQIDDNWLSQAIIAKLGEDNLFAFGCDTYRFKDGWHLLDKVALKNLVREQVALLNEIRAAANLKTKPISANLVNSVSALLAMQIVKRDLRLNGGEPNTVGCTNGDVVLNNQTWELREPRKKITVSAAYLTHTTLMRPRLDMRRFWMKYSNQTQMLQKKRNCSCK